MAKLKNIIKQLTQQDFEHIYDSLMDSNAEKSAYLLKYMYQDKMSDNKIMDELGVNTNAYYTLRSRLNQKIEEYLLEQVESPRTDLLKKVANINEIIFTKKRTITIATLKKLEKELLDYDLSNELTIVYKNLKRIHVHTPDYFTYSQLYNKHIAYMLSVDKAESLLTDYFKKYGIYSFTGDETDQLELTLLNRELKVTRNLYDSHRLYVYESCVNIFHRLFVEEDESLEEEPIEDILKKVNEIFDSYNLDTIYYHLKIIFEFLKLAYYNHYKVYRKVEDFYDEVNDSIGTMLTNYTMYTYPASFLFMKVERHLRLNLQEELYEENQVLFLDYEPDKNDIPTYVSYVTYRALSCFYAEKYDEGARWLNNLLNDVSLKKFPFVALEVKLLLSVQYVMMQDYELFSQLLSSIQRQIRILGKEECADIVVFTKILKTMSGSKANKVDKLEILIDKWKGLPKRNFSPTQYIQFNIAQNASLSK
ncbi:MAG: hypothetical protein ACFB0B_17900 [Thermonemataceae bacterium]